MKDSRRRSCCGLKLNQEPVLNWMLNSRHCDVLFKYILDTLGNGIVLVLESPSRSGVSVAMNEARMSWKFRTLAVYNNLKTYI